MICLEFPSPSASLSEVSITAVRSKHSPGNLQHGFSDSRYLRQVISLLRRERKRNEIGIKELTARAKLRDGVILRAEKHGIVPSCREFRAWAKSLGIPWEKVWTLAFPLADQI